MKKKVDPGKTYIGVVEDLKDPDKLGRVKVRVLDIFDDQALEDIPWATPWKDLGGGQFSLPEKGKVVIVVFEQGDVYKPEFIFTEHWNVNLENKLKSLNDTDYESMRSLIFDHKTQIYVNDSEGLKIDYKFNNINFKDNGININLKDNNMVLNLGDSTANQQMILGTNFMKWMDELVDCFGQNLAFIGNLGAPAVANPKLVGVVSKYKANRDQMFLSHHVNVMDNNQASTVKNEVREETAQAGDTWQSTKTENTMTTVSDETNKPADGVKPKYDEKFAEPPTDVPGLSASAPIPPKPVPPLPEKSSVTTNPKIEKFIWFLKNKEYVLYEKPYELNILAFRTKEKIQTDSGGSQSMVPASITNKFDEELHVFYKNENDNWEHCEYSITTVPGYLPNQKVLPAQVAILRLGQYVEQLSFSTFGGDPNHKCLSFDTCAIHKNSVLDAYDYSSPTEVGNFPITIHRSSDIAQAELVYNYSEGAQVFKCKNQFDAFISLCEKQISIAKKEKFTYTLAFKSEYEKYPDPDVQREKLFANLVDRDTKSRELNTSTQSQILNSKVEFKSLGQNFSLKPENSISLQQMVNSAKKFKEQGYATIEGAPTLDQLLASGKKLNVFNTFSWGGKDQQTAEVDLEKNLQQQVEEGKRDIKTDGIKLFKTIKKDDPNYDKIIEAFNLKDISGDFTQSLFIPFL